MPDPVLYTQTMCVAAGVSALIVLALGLVRRPASPERINLAGVFGVGVGLVAGYYVLLFQDSPPDWPPTNALGRMLLIVFPAVIGIEALAGYPLTPRWFSWFLRVCLAAAAARILLHGSVYLGGPKSELTASQAWVLLILSAVLMAVEWILLSWLSRRTPGVSIPFSLSIASQSAGMTVMLTGYLTGGAAALPLVAALIGAMVGASLTTKRPATHGAIGIGFVGLFGLLFIGRFFGGLSTVQALTILLAPLLCWVTELPGLRNRNVWLVGTVRIVLVAIPLTIVLVEAKRVFDRDTKPLLVDQAAAVGERGA